MTIINVNDKDVIIILAIVTSDWSKLPLYIIAKGKTKRCCSSLGNTNWHWISHSESGWVYENIFIYFIDKINDYFHGQKIHLILDCYAAHRKQSVIEHARNKNINLYFIPAGMTDSAAWQEGVWSPKINSSKKVLPKGCIMWTDYQYQKERRNWGSSLLMGTPIKGGDWGILVLFWNWVKIPLKCRLIWNETKLVNFLMRFYRSKSRLVEGQGYYISGF